MKPLSAEHVWIPVLVRSPSSVMELLESVLAKLLSSGRAGGASGPGKGKHL